MRILFIFCLFLSTPSARRATCRCRCSDTCQTNFYPRPPRGGRRRLQYIPTMQFRNFYPRPPRGGRHALICSGDGQFYFYPRPPRGGRHSYPSMRHILRNFYPRPPRGGRRVIVTPRWWTLYFYPRPPRGGRPTDFYTGLIAVKISIHALREEGD